jgi:hypothetical protein
LTLSNPLFLIYPLNIAYLTLWCNLRAEAAVLPVSAPSFQTIIRNASNVRYQF